MAWLRKWWQIALRGRGREFCHSCGRTVDVVWWEPTDVLWNEISGDDGVLCVRCFDERCAQRGVILTWEPRELVRVR